MIEACLPDSQLWSVAAGESTEDENDDHVARCHHCTSRVVALRKELQSLREAGSFVPVSGITESALPKRIGGYEILAILGQGGQADIYRAWHPRLKIDVVVKWYRVRVNGDAGSLTSTSGLCTVRHANLGQIYDVGVDQGRPFHVTEYVRGDTFGKWIQKYHPTLLRIATVLAEVARAVDFVHQNGALHLDLKPDNILIDDLGNPRVIDFGMAEIANGRTRALSMSPGTPEYMSPEQCVGDEDRIGVASDVYGLGAVLYSALTNQAPRTESHLTLEPNWKLLRQAPKRLRKVCQKSMAISPRQRHGSAAEFAQDLDRFVDLHHWTGRSLSTVVVVLGILGLLLGTAISSLAFGHREQTSIARSTETGDMSPWRVDTQSSSHPRSQWFLTTCGFGPTRINQTLTAAEDQQWLLRAGLDLARDVGPCLLVSGEQDVTSIDFSRELRALSGQTESWVMAKIDSGRVQWAGTLDNIPVGAQEQMAMFGERVRAIYASRSPTFRATLMIPPHHDAARVPTPGPVP